MDKAIVSVQKLSHRLILVMMPVTHNARPRSQKGWKKR
jgi:hypothetical protein